MRVETVLYMELNQELRGQEKYFVSTLFGMKEEGAIFIKNPINREPMVCTNLFNLNDDCSIEYFEILETKGVYVDPYGECFSDLNDPAVIERFKNKMIADLKEEIKIFERFPDRKATQKLIKSRENMLEKVKDLTEIQSRNAETTVVVRFAGSFENEFIHSIKNAIAALGIEGLGLKRLYSENISVEQVEYQI